MATTVTVLGMIGVVLAVVLGFEKAPSGLLSASTFCVFAGPAALVLHLWLNRTMTRAEKRAWLKALTGKRALNAVSDYIVKQGEASAASS